MLAEKAFWDAYYQPANLPPVPMPGDPGRSLRALTRNYDEYIVWNRIYAKYMVRGVKSKVIEIGSAPGHHLIQLNQRFGITPYGVEYSEPGVEQNRNYFLKYGLDPGHVVQADFFDDVFLARYREQFDAVVSRGFIEHFDDVPSVVDRHVALLKTGGRMFVTIPNFRGIYGVWMRRFNVPLLARHNTAIMEGEVFANLFDRPDLKTLFCGYYGTLALGRFKPDGPEWFVRLMRQRHRIQQGLNLLFRLSFGLSDRNHPYWSPFLLYVGDKQ